MSVNRDKYHVRTACYYSGNRTRNIDTSTTTGPSLDYYDQEAILFFQRSSVCGSRNVSRPRDTTLCIYNTIHPVIPCGRVVLNPLPLCVRQRTFSLSTLSRVWNFFRRQRRRCVVFLHVRSSAICREGAGVWQDVLNTSIFFSCSLSVSTFKNEPHRWGHSIKLRRLKRMVFFFICTITVYIITLWHNTLVNKDAGDWLNY